MASTTSPIVSKILHLSDLELALLLCLVSREHGIITTPSACLSLLTTELSLVATRTFGLTCSIIDCTPSTTLDDFASALLLPPKSAQQPQQPDYFVHSPQRSVHASPLSPSSQIANCILAKNLNLAPKSVQIQALELLRTRRIFTRTSVQIAPKQFIFIPVLEAEAPGKGERVTSHLNDFFSLAHWHDPDEGFVNIDEEDEADEVERGFAGGVNRRDGSHSALIPESEISHLAQLSQQVQVDIEVTRYQMNIVSFLRMHRAVADGITPNATKHLDKLMRCLAPLHGVDFVAPALVGVAVKKVYLHRIRITSPEDERSMQWGSKLEAVAAILADMGPEEVVEDVLGMVTAPI
ncbi:hypothetical protein J3458_001351 [Metarhizium acridum]|uniref:magnesium chelatase n=1 Tax=Metarhizium acridum (strain CQMa 102) TaxID=655827 RepID=E9E227_METAQ|nr:uncharacterized protein MAC_03925 [Metarhizium acridum CQMa 102]EFY89943.1 hypothetical protein MAC_03925 [Metarhizium acridum CQMa 102]KAG8424574.1 hypothetical protein J3458_001351 [Metarhizium acridum]